MKKIISSLFVALLFATTISAQNEKTNVCVDNFGYNTSIGTNWVTNLRNNVIQGIHQTGRLNIIDITNLSNLSNDNEQRLGELRQSNVDVLIKGHFNSLHSLRNYKDGKSTYETTADFTLTLVDTKTGAVLGSENFKNTWYSGSTESESITKALEEAIGDMKKFVDNKFKMEAVIKALDQVDPKKGAKTVYVTLGSEAGIQPGQMFDVYQEIEIAGEIGQKQIGTAKAKEVVSSGITLCTVSKGGVEIKNAFDNNVKLIVVSRAKKDLFGLGDILN